MSTPTRRRTRSMLWSVLATLAWPTVADGDVARWAIGATPATPVLIVQ